MSTTPQNVINQALTLLGVLFPAQTPSPSMSADAFGRLNQMLASWSIDRLMVYAIEKQAFSITTGTAAYTWGSGGTWNASPKPIAMLAATAVTATGLRLPLKLVTTAEWSEIADPAASSQAPQKLYDDGEYPLSNIGIWPTPSANMTVEVYAWQPIPQFATLTDTLDMPPGYELAIVYGLAQMLAFVYGRPWTQENEEILQTAKNGIRSINAPPTHITGAGEEIAANAQLAGAGAPPPQRAQ
jgi:hypothetical protein